MEITCITSARRFRARPGYTLKELLIVIAIIVVGLLLLPAIQAAREAGHRASCLGLRTNGIGLALQNYASTYNNAFPPAALVHSANSDDVTVGDYSFLVKILPFLEYDALYKTLPAPNRFDDIDAAMPGNAALAAAMSRQLEVLTCPSNPNKTTVQNPTGNPRQFALTNYKAVGASTRSSLVMAVNRSATPPYGTAAMHPDGALYPCGNNLPLANIADGTSHTIVVMETMDDTNSRWMVGNECTLVALPQASSPTGDELHRDPAGGTYFAPVGFDGEFGDDSAVARAGLRTFFSYDFSPKGADAGKYEDPGWAKGPAAYGPSSAHPGVIMVGFADGSGAALSKKTDAANLFFLVTKSNHDPFYMP